MDDGCSCLLAVPSTQHHHSPTQAQLPPSKSSVMHSALALLCIGVTATTTSVVTGLRRTCTGGMRLQHCNHCRSSPREYVRPRDSYVFNEAPGSMGSRWRARGMWGVGTASRRSSSRRGAAADDEKSNQDWVGFETMYLVVTNYCRGCVFV